MKPLVPVLVSVASAAFLVNCRTTRPAVDYAAYEKMPTLPTSAILRTTLKITPVLRKKAFHGRYGGPGNEGGHPVDPLDELFRKHDIVYYEASNEVALHESDRALVAEMKKLESADLGDKAHAYRERAIRFFDKPGGVSLGKSKPVGGPHAEALDSAKEVRHFLTDPRRRWP